MAKSKFITKNYVDTLVFRCDFSANAPAWSGWLNSLKHSVGGQIEFNGSFSQIKKCFDKEADGDTHFQLIFMHKTTTQTENH